MSESVRVNETGSLVHEHAVHAQRHEVEHERVDWRPAAHGEHRAPVDRSRTTSGRSSVIA